MFRKTMLCLMAALCVLGLPLSALAAQVDSDSVYCFTQEDFSMSEEPLAGICLTGLPENGAVLLGTRILRPGDILTAEQGGCVRPGGVSAHLPVRGSPLRHHDHCHPGQGGQGSCC